MNLLVFSFRVMEEPTNNEPTTWWEDCVSFSSQSFFPLELKNHEFSFGINDWWKGMTAAADEMHNFWDVKSFLDADQQFRLTGVVQALALDEDMLLPKLPTIFYLTFKSDRYHFTLLSQYNI